MISLQKTRPVGEIKDRPEYKIRWNGGDLGHVLFAGKQLSRIQGHMLAMYSNIFIGGISGQYLYRVCPVRPLIL